MNVRRLVPRTATKTEDDPRRRIWGPLTKGLLLIFALLAVLAVMTSIGGERAQARAVLSLPPESRGRLYERVFENLQFCEAQSDQGFDAFCAGEAEFIVKFPECGAACEKLARRRLSHPAR